MAEVNEKLITADSLKAAYDALLAAISLQNLGVTVTAEEINKLSGITENIQDKINVLSNDVKTAGDNANSALELANGLDESRPIMKTASVSLMTASWAENRIAVPIDGMPKDMINNIVLPFPARENEDAYNDAFIKCVEQNEGELVFSCENIPVVDIVVNIVWFEQKEVVE